MALFGQSTSGSLFGGTPSQTSQGLFGQPTLSQPSQFGSLGSSASSLTQQFAAGTPSSTASQPSLFGALGAQQSQPSLFGSGSAPQTQQALLGSTSAPQSLPSLFGSSLAQSQQSLFGSTQTPQSQQSLFGSTAIGSSQPSLFSNISSQQSGFAGFGNNPSGQNSQFALGSAFGQSQGSVPTGISGQTQPQSSFGSFGFSSSPGLGSIFGGQQASQHGLASQATFQTQSYQQSVLAQNQLPEPVPGSTRVNDLPETAIDALEVANKALKDERGKAARILALQSSLEDATRMSRERCSVARRRLVQAQTCVESLATNADALRHAVREERRSADSVSHSLSQLSKSMQSDNDQYTSAPSTYVSSWNLGLIPATVTHVNPEYFASVISDLEERSSAYRHQIDQIAEYLQADGDSWRAGAAGVESLQARYRSTSSRGPDLAERDAEERLRSGEISSFAPESRGRVVEEIIRRQYDYFMHVANNIAQIHEALAQLKDSFVEKARSSDPDAVDPFAQASARDRAEEERKRRVVNSMYAENLLRGPQSDNADPTKSAAALASNAPYAAGSSNAAGMGAGFLSPHKTPSGNSITQSAPAIATGGLPSISGFLSTGSAPTPASYTSQSGSGFGNATPSTSQHRRNSGSSSGRRSYRSR